LFYSWFAPVLSCSVAMERLKTGAGYAID